MEPLVSTEWLAERLDADSVVIADVRWKPGKPELGRRAFAESHIPGAVFVDLDDDLSDRSDPELRRGRHPLPAAEAFVERLARLGMGCDTTVIACDDMFGGLAARLWWMLRWVGHTQAAVLDGGLTKWSAEGRSTEPGPGRSRAAHPKPIAPQPEDAMVLPSKTAVADALAEGCVLLDARAAERFRGDVEPIDKRAGHIQGALSAPFSDNLTGGEVKTFKSADALRRHYEELGVTAGAEAACYCGSGVTACHDVLALTLAGLPMPRMYPGSWSEWSLDPAMPTVPARAD